MVCYLIPSALCLSNAQFRAELEKAIKDIPGALWEEYPTYGLARHAYEHAKLDGEVVVILHLKGPLIFPFY